MAEEYMAARDTVEEIVVKTVDKVGEPVPWKMLKNKKKPVKYELLRIIKENGDSRVSWTVDIPSRSPHNLKWWNSLRSLKCK